MSIQATDIHNSVLTTEPPQTSSHRNVQLVEETISDLSGEFTEAQLWKKLPIRLPWKTYSIIVDYLEELDHIVISDNGVISYIWNPPLVQHHLDNPHLHFDNVKKKAKDKSNKS